MTRGAGDDESAIRAMLGGIDPAAAPAHRELLEQPPPVPPFDESAASARMPRLRRLTRRTRLAFFAVPVLLAGAGGVAVGWDEWAAQPENKDLVRCYADTDLRHGEKFHGSSAFIASRTEFASEHGLELCSDLWRRGLIAPGANAYQPPSESHPVPPLITCVVDGYVSVLPAIYGETCMSLKLRTWPAQ